MTQKIVFTDLHDAKLRSALLCAGEVAFVFAGISSFFATTEADVYDVKSSEATLTIRGLTSVRIESPLAPGTTVSDGQILVDGVSVQLNALGSRTGRCRVVLQLSDGTEETAEGAGLEFTYGQFGEAFEQWRGPI